MLDSAKRIAISPIPPVPVLEDLICVMATALDEHGHAKGLLHTCLDEAGKWKDRDLSFAGWISDASRWNIFQEKWFSLMDEFPGMVID